MTSLILNLEPIIHLTDERFYQLCQVNPDTKLERTVKGELVIVPPTGGEGGSRNRKLTQRLGNWADQDGTGEAFDSSTMFQLPNGAYRSPDAAWVSLFTNVSSHTSSSSTLVHHCYSCFTAAVC